MRAATCFHRACHNPCVSISDRDRKILWARAHNACAFCRRSLVEDATDADADSVVGDEAHIVAQSGKGPRAGLIPTSQIDLYENLILLCKVHHKLIDDQPATYTVEHLREMKRGHEMWAEARIRRADSDSAGDKDDPILEIVSRVPETSAEVEYVLGHRPWAWEYILYAGLLQVGVRTARQEAGPPRRPPTTFKSESEALRHIRSQMDSLMAIVKEVTVGSFDPERMSRAFGEPGRPGEFRLIYALARQLLDAYGKLLAWSVEVRSTDVPRRLRRVFEIVSRLSLRPMTDIEAYVTQLVASLNDAIRQAGEGRKDPLVLTLTCTVTADERLVEQLMEEFRRVR